MGHSCFGLGFRRKTDETQSRRNHAKRPGSQVSSAVGRAPLQDVRERRGPDSVHSELGGRARGRRRREPGTHPSPAQGRRRPATETSGSGSGRPSDDRRRPEYCQARAGSREGQLATVVALYWRPTNSPIDPETARCSGRLPDRHRRHFSPQKGSQRRSQSVVSQTTARPGHEPDDERVEADQSTLDVRGAHSKRHLSILHRLLTPGDVVRSKPPAKDRHQDLQIMDVYRLRPVGPALHLPAAGRRR